MNSPRLGRGELETPRSPPLKYLPALRNGATECSALPPAPTFHMPPDSLRFGGTAPQLGLDPRDLRMPAAWLDSAREYGERSGLPPVEVAARIAEQRK